MNHILILDDKERVTTSLKREIASFEEYETGQIETASSAREAIELARHAAEHRQPFNVFLIDQNLDAEMDGIQAMQELLTLHPDADTIIFTGYDSPEDGLRAYEAGASRYLPKPFEAKELEFVLKELERSRKVRINEARQRRQFEVVTKITEAVGASLDMETTMDAILRTLVEDVFDGTRLCVLLYDEDTESLRFAPATTKYYQIDNPLYNQKIFPLNGKTIACRTARKTLECRDLIMENIPNVTNDEDYLELNPEIKSEFCISLLNSSKDLLGVLALERDRLNGFDQSDEALIKIAARHIGIAIERAQQSESLNIASFISMQTSWAVNIVHDLNGEVGKIANWAYLIQKGVPENPTLVDYAAHIEESAYKMAASNPVMARQPQCIDINATVQKYADTICAQKGYEVDLEYQFQGMEAYTTINPIRFQFVIKQMITNALNAMRHIESKRIIISTRQGNRGFIEIHFKDFGDGIEMNKREWIFRKPHTTRDDGSGGYGLFLAYHMIQQMGGKLKLEPYRAGEGATFSIHLPLENPSKEGK
jgi:signal transduction histidine kinase/DNA-binding response OmpR family regulator